MSEEEPAEPVKRNSTWASWVKKRTKFERCSVVLLGIATLVIIGLIVPLVLIVQKKDGMKTRHIRSVTHRMDKKTSLQQKYINRMSTASLSYAESKDEVICLTTDCVHAAGEILSFIDESADPCADFYNFACGNFLKTTKIPPKSSEVNSFTILEDLLHDQLKEIIEEPALKDQLKPIIQLKAFYNSCMDTSDVEDDNLSTVKDILKDLGGWPAIEGVNWSEKNFNWVDLLHNMRWTGLDTNLFFHISVGPNLENTTQRLIYLDQLILETNKDDFLEVLHSTAYLDYLLDLALFFEANATFAAEEVQDVADFSIRLANITNAVSRSDAAASYNVITVRELQRRFTSISWINLLNGLFAVPIKPYSYDDLIVVPEVVFLEKLEKLLKSSSNRVLANYMMFSTIRTLIPFLPSRLKHREKQFQKTFLGSVRLQEQWKKCISLSIEFFDVILGALHVRRHSSRPIKVAAAAIAADIGTEMAKTLEKVEWMDNSTREIAVEKIQAMKLHVAHDEELFDDHTLLQYYSKLRFYSDNYLHMRNQLFKFKADKQFLRLSNSYPSEWEQRIPPITINAGYSLFDNSIPAMLREPFFSRKRPHFMNYASIGSIIGHEMTHGFDAHGKQFDKDGNLAKWWSQQTENKSAGNVDCVIDQYRKYEVPEVKLKVDGEATQEENIADNGGLKLAYFAYQAWVQRNGREPRLPGLNYTTDQLFWISFARTWCSKQTKEHLKVNILTDSHSPGRYRVLGPLMNSEEFSEDFSCPAGAKMNAARKCQIW